MIPLGEYRSVCRLTSAVTLVVAFGCAPTGPVDPREEAELSCSIPVADILPGARKDGIPALTDPERLQGNSGDPRYPALEDRIIGVLFEGEPIAVPERIFWYHEIVNVTLAGSAVAVTHCPLTGSSLAFARGPVDGVEFGVSGLLYQNNLIMYDRSSGEESLWPQMLRGARCGDRDGLELPMVPVVEMTWAGWLTLYPDSEVVSEATGFDFDYDYYPYGDYNRPDNELVLYPLADPMDLRRPPKERALGIPDGEGGIAYPFGELVREASRGGSDLAVVAGGTSGGDFVVFWDGRREGGMAFRPVIDARVLTFEVEGSAIRDVETGSAWTVDGVATSGPLFGRSLEPVAEAFVAYWFAWPAFYPDVELWRSS